MSNPTTPTSTAPPKRRRRRMGCQIFLLLAVLLVVTAAYICHRLWTATPTYWTENETFLKKHDNADLMDMADRAEKRLLSELTDAGSDMDAGPGSSPTTATTNPATTTAPDITALVGTNLNQPRKIHLSTAEINAWLAVKLETWAAYQNITLPPQIGGYMVTTEGQNLVFAFQYNGQGISQVVSVVFHVDMLPNGQASVKIESLRGGELPLPKGLTMNQVQRGLGKEGGGDDIARAAALIDGKVFSPVHNLDSARQIRLLDYKLRPDGADVTVQTELRRGVTLPGNDPPQP